MAVSTKERGLLQEQVAQMRIRYPELHDYLHQRDKQILRSLARIPSPADVELSASMNIWARLAAIRNDLTAGLDDLGGAPRG